MRIEIPQIFWHGNRDRILSIDFYPNSNIIVTCGAEEEKMWIKLWEIEEIGASSDPIDTGFKTGKNNPFMSGMITEKPETNNVNMIHNIIYDENPFNNLQNSNRIRPKFLYEISGAHTATVNIVRFSPNGMYLATGGDDSAIVIWVQKSRPIEFGSNIEKVCWSNHKILRGHLSDIYDICWSPDSKYLISGSVDNSAIVWSLEKGKGIQRLNDHNKFVQGVAWDPNNKYLVTQSSDKSAVIYKNAKDKREIKFFKSHKIKKSTSITNENNEDNNMDVIEENSAFIGKEKKQNNFCFFADDIQCSSFVRRLSWSPDGSFCLLVGGIHRDNNEIENVVWGFHRKNMKKPAFMLPTLDKSPVCVRFCPIIFRKEDTDESCEELISLEYKIAFAVGTIDSIYIYDTQSTVPRSIHTNIHYLQINDLSWRGDSMLAACSSDGYITFIIFEKNEIGIQAQSEELNEKLRNYIQQYSSIDINKSIFQQTTNTIRVVKKKEEVNSNVNLIIEDEKINQNSTSNLFDLKNINIEIKNRNEGFTDEKSNTFVNPLLNLNGNNSLNTHNVNNNQINENISIINTLNNNQTINNVQNNSGEKAKKKIVPTMITKY